jgi:NAD(P)H-dependent FMN reductase
MQDRPSLQELLQEVERFLQEEVAPQLEGPRRFQAIVAANALRIVRRELELGEGQLAQQWQALDALLGPEPLPQGLAAQREALRRRVAELCRRIQAGQADQEGPFRQRLLDFLWLLARHKLEVNDPGWLQRQRA